jgi:hypothetical protein
MSGRRTRANNHGKINLEELQQQTDEGHVSQRRKWLFAVPQVPLRLLDFHFLD